MKCQELFTSLYKREPAGTAFCSYRICPLGAHIDHQNGKVTGFAIDKGISIAYSPKENGVIELTSLQFEKRAQFHVNAVPKTKQNDWADYLRGATIKLGEKYSLTVGLCGVIEGSLPIGGLSSSAAVIIAFMSALCKVNGIAIPERELITMAMGAENSYVGVSCGKLDQSCEVFSKKDHLLYLDTLDDSYELIPTNPNMKPYKVAIFFSGVERTLVGSKYNTRVDECRATAYALKAFENLEYGKLKHTLLREVPYEVFLKHKDKLPTSWRMRAEHYYSEFARVEAGVQAWRDGDIEKFGKLMNESGYSSIHSWESGSPELKALYEILTKTEGVYGARFSGAGFKGCCLAIINPEYEQSILESVEKQYLSLFPELTAKFSSHICHSADGVQL